MTMWWMGLTVGVHVVKGFWIMMGTKWWAISCCSETCLTQTVPGGTAARMWPTPMSRSVREVFFSTHLSRWSCCLWASNWQRPRYHAFRDRIGDQGLKLSNWPNSGRTDWLMVWFLFCVSRLRTINVNLKNKYKNLILIAQFPSFFTY